MRGSREELGAPAMWRWSAVVALCFWMLVAPGRAGAGQIATAELVKDINSHGVGSSLPSRFVKFRGLAYFVADDGVHGAELWRSDGTAGGTAIVKDIYQGINAGSGPASLTAFRGSLYFTAEDEKHGRELWKSDGTRAGTRLFADLRPDQGDPSQIDVDPIFLTPVGDTLFFNADDGTHGPELWATDGTAGSLRMLTDIPEPQENLYPLGLTRMGDVLMFFTMNVADGAAVWTSDGTAAGTLMVKELPLHHWGGALAATPSRFFFSDFYEQLWVSDGTEQGTVSLLKEDHPYIFWESLITIGDTAYFDGRSDETGAELWRSDGTLDGTTLLTDVAPGESGDGPNSSEPSDLTPFNDGFLFAATTPDTGTELWFSDGTPEGTHLVANVDGSDTSSLDSLSNEIAVIGSRAFFAATKSANGSELWGTDGTSEGTDLVTDIQSGGFGSNPSKLADINGTLFFSANDGVHGRELWKVEGDPADTSPPETEILSVVSTGTSMTAEFSSTDPNAAFDCRLDTKDWRPCGSPAKYRALDRGRHLFRVRAIDMDGNVDPTRAREEFRIRRR